MSEQGRPIYEQYNKKDIRDAATALGLPTRVPGTNGKWKSKNDLIELCENAWRAAHPEGEPSSGSAPSLVHCADQKASAADARSENVIADMMEHNAGEEQDAQGQGRYFASGLDSLSLN